jgi:hypothetical protein
MTETQFAYNNGWHDGRKALLAEQQAAAATKRTVRFHALHCNCAQCTKDRVEKAKHA